MTTSRNETIADEYLADWREAQEAGHHLDCDGFMIVHRVEIQETRYPGTKTRTYVAVCEECGSLHVGSFGDRSTCQRNTRGHAQEVRCDLRCKEWT